MKYGISVTEIRQQAKEAVKKNPKISDEQIHETGTRLGRYFANNFGKVYVETALAERSKLTKRVDKPKPSNDKAAVNG